VSSDISSSIAFNPVPGRADEGSVMSTRRDPTAPRDPDLGGRASRRVLFADDDGCILAGVADSLRRAPSRWETRFALGGEAALDLIAAKRFDVVVCDLSMPRVDGVAVLERARELQPDAVRIVLSGGAEPGAALAVTRVAHRYLAKPYREDDLRIAIDRACDLRQLLREEGWRRAAGGVMALPSCPRLYTELTELILDPDATAARAAALVERDVAMSAKVLQLVNSAFFGLGRRVARISEAVHYLGLETLRALVLHAGAFEAFAPRRPIDGFDIAALQCRSHLAARIARRLSPDPRTRDDAFTAGMLHGVGLLVLAKEDPYEFAAAIADARRAATPLHEVEYAHHGSSHAELGAYVLGLWGLPEAIVDGVAHQHRVDRLAGPALDTALVVHAATVLATDLCPDAVATGAGPLDAATLAVAGVADRIPDWRALAATEAVSAHHQT
jgi:HD-like signal output (HDOD) protein/ActR/RegA family two-component response regulator